MKCHLKGVKETSSKDGIVGILHVYHIKSYVLVRALDKVQKDTGSDMEPTGSIFFLPKPYNSFDASFNYFLLKPISSKVERNNIYA
jgi:hypothetical protein